MITSTLSVTGEARLGMLLNASSSAIFMRNPFENQTELLFTSADPFVSSSAPFLPFELNFQNIVLCVFLFIMICLTIGGNIFVILAICADTHLRSPTHFLMGSLAVADLLLGTTVLPFSAVKLLMNERWPFGDIICDIWLATDVLCCTASIYLVLVISIDRYIGVKRPLAYPLIVTKKRIYIVIALVWVLSLIVSLAPQIGLKSPKKNTYECEVNQNLAYALSSALISFYIPLLVILIIYYKIFKEARNQMKFLQTGTKTSKTGTKTDETIVTLRVHIGPTRKLASIDTPPKPICQRCANRNNLNSSFHKADIRKEHSYAGYGNYDSSPVTTRNPKTCSVRLNSNSSSTMGTNATSATQEGQKTVRKFSSSLILKDTQAVDSHRRLVCPQCSNRLSTRSLHLNLSRSSSSIAKSQNGSTSANGNVNNPITSKLAKFKREQKAAKTLAIVVGCFVLCWAPFFIILPIESLCTSCNIPPILFKIFFWLGYYNSTMNPLIYAFSSREFRKAYKRILQCKLNKYSSNVANYNRSHLNYAIYSNQPALCNRKITSS